MIWASSSVQAWIPQRSTAHSTTCATGPHLRVRLNAAAQHIIPDGHGKVVIVASPAGPAPNNRVWYEPGRLMSAGGNQFLVGVGAGPPPVTATTGQLITYRFDHPGRYLVICMQPCHTS